MHFLPPQHLLVPVVGVVGRDRSRGGEARAEQVEGFSVELLKKIEQLGGRHELCFALHVMQTRVHGIAFRRASAIGSPQSRQTP